MFNVQFISTILILILIIEKSPGQQAIEKTYVTLEEAISRALSQNNLVKASKFSLKKANWDKKHAWTLLLPKVGFNTRYTKIDQQSYEERDFFRRNVRLFFPNLPPDFEVPQSSYRESFYTSLDLSMPIFNGVVLNGLYVANAAEDASIQINESTRRNIVYQVVSSYLSVINLTDVLDLQKEYLILSRLNFEKAERLFNAGRYSNADVLRWKVELQQQKSTVVNSESQLRTSKTILKRLLNIPMKETLVIENSISDNILNESEKLAGMADEEILEMIQLSDELLMEANAALAAAKSNEQISKHLYHNSYSSFLPNVNLTYSYGWRENNTIELDDYSPKTLMVNVSMPLFTSFQNFTSVKSSYYDYKSVQENFYDQLQNTRLVLTETVNKIINLKTQKELSITNVEFNEKNYKIVEQQKEKGLVSNLDFIDAKLNLQNSKLNRINTDNNFIAAVIELYYLLGKLDTLIEDI